MDQSDKIVKVLPHVRRNGALEGFLRKAAPGMTLHEVDFSEAEIPLLGYVAAGRPIERIEARDAISIPADMAGRHRTYALQVRGDSMVDEGIRDGDYIVIQERCEARNGETVVALINDRQVTLKKFYIEKDGIRLQPANADMEPLFIKNCDVKILGVVFGLIRKFK